jgi:hypothetical protein
MTRVTQKNFAIAALVVSLLIAVPASLVVALILVNSVNPLQTIFISSFDVRNESREPLRFWVAGTHESGRVHLLPLFATSFPALPSFRNGGFNLQDRETTRITYDWDDHNFSSILVQRGNRDLFAVDVDIDTRRAGCCYRNHRESYVLPAVSAMRAATPAERAALGGTPSIEFRLVAVWVLPFLPLYFYRLQRRLGGEASGG